MEKRENTVVRDDLNIMVVFEKETLEALQDKISKATGLAFVTVDYRGEPVTEMTGFTPFCQNIRRDPEAASICKSSDAYGAIQGTVTRKTHIYRCPCGLMEVAIPIVVEGHYLGGFVGGQIRCDDAPDSIFSLKNLRQCANKSFDATQIELLKSVPAMGFAQFEAVAELTGTIITQLGEQKINTIKANKELKRTQKKVTTLCKELKEISQKGGGMPSIHERLNLHFLFNSLSSVANLSIIEEADRTNEMVTLLSEYLRTALRTEEDSWSMEKEMAHLEGYLKIQQVRFGSKLSYEVEMPSNCREFTIFSQCTMPFVEDAVTNGLMALRQGGYIKVAVKDKGVSMAISIMDDGKAHFKKVNHSKGDTKAKYSTWANILAVKERFEEQRDEGYLVTEQVDEEGRNLCVLHLPKGRIK